MVKSLHPNLARIAAEYDEIVLQAQIGHITPEQANARISRLIAKDDQGLDWSINPTTGNWVYKNSKGELVEAFPPEYGFTSPTPKDIGSPTEKDFDSRLSFHEVDESKLNNDSVLGATRRVLDSGKKSHSTYKKIILSLVLLIVLALALIV